MSLLQATTTNSERRKAEQPSVGHGATPRAGRGHQPAEASWCGWLVVMASRLVGTFRADRGAQERIRRLDHLPEAQYTAYFARLLHQVDPHQAPTNGPPQHARMSAGRWLALRRLRLGLSSTQITERTRIDPTTLLLLEAGLADSTLASKESWVSLAEVLAGGEPTATLVAAVVIALGHANALALEIVAQVADDLGPIIAQASAGSALSVVIRSVAGEGEGADDVLGTECVSRDLVGPAQRSVASKWLYSRPEAVESIRPAEPAAARCGARRGSTGPIGRKQRSVRD